MFRFSEQSDRARHEPEDTFIFIAEPTGLQRLCQFFRVRDVFEPLFGGFFLALRNAVDMLIVGEDLHAAWKDAFMFTSRGNWFTRIFSRIRTTKNHPRRGRLAVEELEPRNLPQGGTWTPLANLAPDAKGIQAMILLSDGTVMAQGGSDSADKHWRLLAPPQPFLSRSNFPPSPVPFLSCLVILIRWTCFEMLFATP
jgi:hypothetical protein